MRAKRKHICRILAGVCALTMCAAAVPASAVQAVTAAPMQTVQAQATLQTRDILCRNEDVNRWESEHFQFIWGKNGADSSKITESFLQENAKNLEACWDVYMNDLAMDPPTQSVNLDLRDGNEYKVNFYLSGTGLSNFTDDWAYMAYDSQGFPYMFCCVGAMQNSPNPSWVLPHEFGHVVTAAQRGWNSNAYATSLYESVANWYREQFLASDYYSQWASVTGTTDYFETYMKNLCFTPISGRDNYSAWVFFQYLTENPDDLGNYGADFVKRLMQECDTTVDGGKGEYLYDEVERLGGTDIKDTLGHYAKRLATLDFRQQSEYRRRQNELLSQSAWNWGEIFTVLEQVKENTYAVPTERAPQQFGVNLVPLSVTGDTITVTLESLTDVAGADWRACIAVEQRDGTTRYSDLFSDGDTMSMRFDASTDSAAYLTVTATPDSNTYVKSPVGWPYTESPYDEIHFPFENKTRYPYAVTIEGAGMQQTQPSAAASRGSYHTNGGGFVASGATVADSVYVGPNAKVLGNATVTGNAVIDDYAVVTGSANVSGNAVIKGHAIVAERATVKDYAIVADHAGVMGNAVVSGNARVLESGLVFVNYKVSGNATVKGVAFALGDGSASNQAVLDGDCYEDNGRSLTQGTIYGWTTPDKYVNSRTYTDGQYNALEFSEAGKMQKDVRNSTYGTLMNGAAWEETRTSGRGVITFDGKDDCLLADSSYAALREGEYQTAVLMRDNDFNGIFRFGDTDTSVLLFAKDGRITFGAQNGGTDEAVYIDDAYVPGEWVTIRVILDGDTATLVTNNGRETKTASGTVTADPVDVLSEDAAYCLGGYNSQSMNGSMDYFRVYYKAAGDPEYYYTETEDISEEPTAQESALSGFSGDLDGNGVLNVLDLTLLKQYVLTGRYTAAEQFAGDCNRDGVLSLTDIIALQHYLVGDRTEYTGQHYEVNIAY
ncbi:MAG: hypothetical protein IJ055_01005 [Oscillospiraceae bacterium]|nr:hypothetical protein [Oscillospiraceae bacterium]